MASENLFSTEDEVNEDITSAPEFVSSDDGSYVVIARFRNEKDFYEFADLIGQPKLKVYNKTLIRKTVYPDLVGKDNPFEEFEE